MPDLASHLDGPVQVLHNGDWRDGRLESYHVLAGVPAVYVSFVTSKGRETAHWFDESNVRTPPD
jgi:phage gp37-like protein